MGADPGDSNTRSLSDDEFAARLARLGAFERRPLLAVAVSGGADSMALTLLADRWARARMGRVAALTVDHRLRAESTAEVAQVRAWLSARGIDQHVLVWQGPYPDRDRQAAARGARYRLLEAWCEAAGCLHLLTAHHQEDQAETFWLRLARGSGVDGLAAMPVVSERAACRIVRPLLDVPPGRLAARLRADGQEWLEDPSNRNTGYARVRMRRARGLLASEGLGADRLADTIRHLGRARAALEAEEARLLARAAHMHPAGFAWLDPKLFAAAAPEIALRALAAVLVAVSGAEYPPRLHRLERVHGELTSGALGQGRTLGGCRLLTRRQRILVAREPAAAAAPASAPPGTTLSWDGRFRIVLPERAPIGLAVAALMRDRHCLSPNALKVLERMPASVRPSLPALRDRQGLAAVPTLGWVRPGLEDTLGALRARFRPLRPLAPLGFTVV